MNSFLRYLFIFSALSHLKCTSSGNIKSKIATYQMISYESKAEVIQADFPTIKILNDRNFEIYQRTKLINNGTVEHKNDSIFFNLQNGSKLYGVVRDSAKGLLRVSRLVNINVEAPWGDFQKVE